MLMMQDALLRSKVKTIRLLSICTKRKEAAQDSWLMSQEARPASPPVSTDIELPYLPPCSGAPESGQTTQVASGG